MITKPFFALFMLIFIIISYSLVITFFAGALVSIIGAAAVTLAFVYEAFKIPSEFAMEMVGTVGAGLLGGSICFLTSFGLYKLARLFIRISVRMAGTMVKKSGEQLRPIKKPHVKKVHSRLLLYASLIVFLSGIVLFSVSGLPYRYFTIFNSMKPESVNVVTSGHNPVNEDIEKINVSTAHSHVRLLYNNSDEIIISYEQPDWLDYSVSIDGDTLSFHENSNGRLPLFELVSMHESITQVTVLIPKNYNPEIILIKSKGGSIYLENVMENIEVITYTGGIELEKPDTADNIYINVITRTGNIEAEGIPAGHESSRGIEYSVGNSKADKTILLESSRGDIIIR
jgi:hypothetical protein